MQRRLRSLHEWRGSQQRGLPSARPERETGTVAVRILVVDDEPLARAGLRRLISGMPGFQVAAEAANGLEAVRAIGATQPDLVLLDVQMPGCDGFEVIRRVGPARMPAVVFVTAFDSFAVRAFEVQALDYVLKPVSESRLRKALAQAAALGDRANAARRLAALIEAPAERLEVRIGARVLLLSPDEIDWIEGASYYSMLHAGRETYLMRETLQSLESRLQRDRFVRVHRSAIVRLDRIRELRAASAELVLYDGTCVRASRNRWTAVVAA